MNASRIGVAVFLHSLLWGVALDAHAVSWEAGGVNADLKVTFNYGVAMRMQAPDQALINGPIDPFELHLDQAANGGGFTHTGLSKTINQDDGDRNFAKWSLVNNRLSAIADLHITWNNLGAVIGGDGFYDAVYHRRNHNDSPNTVNKTGPNDEFTDAARFYDGRRFRLLDAYAYGDWNIGESMRLDVRAGNQLVAWGESLFLPGISYSQSTADATKAFTPGVEIKQILLPTPQISLNLAIGDAWNVMGYYKFNFKPNEIFPVGDYLSPTDSVGPGAQFSYGAVNPVYLQDCPGLFGAASFVCSLGMGAGGPVLGAPPYILIPYRGELPTSRYGQYGLGGKWQVTPQTTLGLYGLRYTDPNPSVIQHSGYPVVATFPTTVTTQAFNEPTPDYYNVIYFEGIRMLAGSYSTVLGPISLAGEVSYRNGASIAVQAVELGTIDPVFVRGNVVQALTSVLYAGNPHLWFDDVAIVGEFGYLRVLQTDQAQAQPGITPVGNGDTLFYSRDAFGFQALMLPTKRNVFEGWDLTTPIGYGWLVKGTPSIPGAFGALYGEGDMRLTVGVSFTYLENLQVGLGYNFFFGNSEKNIGPSFLKQNPYTDRDNLSLNVKYSI